MVSRIMTYLRQTGSILLMLLSFVVYVGSVTLFNHVHTIDGKTVYHSHLHTGSSDQPDHTHSPLQFKTIAALAMYIALAAVAAQHIDLPTSWAIALGCADTISIFTRSVRHFSLRAPPAIM